MKEQLAAMTIIELVRTAHSYATSIQQIDTHSAIVREMASRLEALNLAHIGGMEKLRSANNEVGNLRSVLGIIASSKPIDGEEVVCDFDTLVSLASSALDNAHQADAWQREQMAKGVDRFGQYHNFSEKLFIQKEAQKFSAKLRNGEAV